MSKPMFRVYDHVRVKPASRWCGNSAVAMPENADAIVEEADESKNGRPNTYALFVKDHGSCAWFDEDDLELVDEHRPDLKEQWEEELRKRDEQQSDLDWIFAQGKEHGEDWEIPGASLEALFHCVSDRSMWGSHGEGYCWFMNAMAIHDAVKPFLIAGDKKGWLLYAEAWKSKIEAANTAVRDGMELED